MKKYWVMLLGVVLLLAGCAGSIVITPTQSPTAAVTKTALPASTRLPTPSKVPTAGLPSSTLTAAPLAIDPPQRSSIGLYDLVELDLQTTLRAENPYDPNELELKVVFSAPSGKQVSVGAFWYQDYIEPTHLIKDAPGWKVRFTPDETGEWAARASAPAFGLQSELVKFNVTDSPNPGFVRVNPANPRYFAMENGDFYFPIGLNMGWWPGGTDPVEVYGRWLKTFSANGGNTVRVWMAAWSFGIEWKDTGLGNYDNRQYEAWLLDQLFRLADTYHVKIILVLINHGPFSLFTNTEWVDNPYNADLGGPLADPGQFVTDPVAKSYFQRRLNYIINRWSYSPDLLAWEWFNEVNLTTISDEDLVPWLQEMTAYLQQRDVNHHLTTISFAMDAASPIWQLPELDIVQKHEYSSQCSAPEHDLGGRAGQDFQDFADAVPMKPILMGEFGYSATNYGDDVEKTGIHLHNGIWATTFSGYAGSGMYWWWDIYIEANDLWHEFSGLARFLQAEDLTQYQPFSPLQISGPDGKPAEAQGLGLSGEVTLVWLRSNAYTVEASIQARNGSQGSSAYRPPLMENLVLTLAKMDGGEYRVEWYDPQAAQWIKEEEVSAQDFTLTIPIPAFRMDLAAKITKIP